MKKLLLFKRNLVKANFKKFLLLSMLFPSLLLAKKYNESFLWNPNDLKKGDLVENIEQYDTTINWSSGKMITKTSVSLRYNDPNIGRKFKNLNTEIQSQLRRKMIKALGYLRISDIFLLRDYYSLKSETRFEIIAGVDNAFFFPPVNRSGTFLGVAELNLYGPKGLAKIFYRDIKETEVHKYTQDPPPRDLEFYDTLVIDTLIFKEFNPSIRLHIYDQDGTLLHGAETMEPKALEEHGVCYYTTSLYQAFFSRHSGKKFFYVIPYAIKGKMKTDIVLHNQDAARLLSHPKSLEALKKGRVIIVRPKRASK